MRPRGGANIGGFMKKLQLAVLAVVAFFTLAGAGTASESPRDFTVAFNSPNSLPANVDSMDAAAGGTITVKLPEVGGIGVQSSNPNFAADIAKNAQVKSA